MSETDSNLTVLSTSPHAHSGASVPRIMLDVLIALLPATGVAVYAFGWHAVRLIGLCVAVCMAGEWAARRLMGRDAGIGDLSAAVTGLLLALNLPSGLPSWMAATGSLFAIIIAKQVFGGLGYNVFNPALIGRVMLLISFPVQMTTWSVPHRLAESLAPAVNHTGGIADGITMATPLGWVKTALTAGQAAPLAFSGATAWDFFLGLKPGCIGETSGLALLLGGLYLLWRRCIYWQVPVAYIGTVLIFSTILWRVNPAVHMNPLFHLLSGGLLLGAFFMATDMVTSPVTRKGMLVFGVGCGILTMLIRARGGYPEGVSFAILLMNALTPLINRYTRPRTFGHALRKAAPDTAAKA